MAGDYSSAFFYFCTMHKMTKVVTILGARPQFIKAAVVSSQMKGRVYEILVHTGQHYDANMSDVFFEELNIPRPKYQLHIGSGSHGAQTGEMLREIERVLLLEKPDFVMVYGDTNSTLAGALAASKLLIPVIHVEAGLRSFNKAMPEEQNRILTDHISDLLCAPTQTAVDHLRSEGITKGVHLVGDVMYDGMLHFSKIAKEKSQILSALNLQNHNFVLCTIHRAENTNDPQRLHAICAALSEVNIPIVFPMHPRTKKRVEELGITLGANIKVTEPLGYLDMIRLMMEASRIVTDSGGIQKEAFFLNKPCVTVRDQTEWVETVQNGWNVLVGADKHLIKENLMYFNPTEQKQDYFGEGNTAELIVNHIENWKA